MKETDSPRISSETPRTELSFGCGRSRWPPTATDSHSLAASHRTSTLILNQSREMSLRQTFKQEDRPVERSALTCRLSLGMKLITACPTRPVNHSCPI